MAEQTAFRGEQKGRKEHLGKISYGSFEMKRHNVVRLQLIGSLTMPMLSLTRFAGIILESYETLNADTFYLDSPSFKQLRILDPSIAGVRVLTLTVGVHPKSRRGFFGFMPSS